MQSKAQNRFPLHRKNKISDVNETERNRKVCPLKNNKKGSSHFTFLWFEAKVDFEVKTAQPCNRGISILNW
jgi:hypothetical protein